MWTRRSLCTAAAAAGAGILSVLASPVRAAKALAKKKQETLEDLKDLDLGAAGPMVGDVSSRAASIWMYSPAGAAVRVTASPRDGDRKLTARLRRYDMADLQVRGQAWAATFSDLEPSTAYDFDVALDGQVAPEHRGSFTSAPKQGEPTRFRVALTSCMKHFQPQTSWPLLLADQPDLHLTLGDTVYVDTTDPVFQWRHHLRYRRLPEFAAVMRSMPNYAVWDDHDYGPNNSDGTAPGKQRSLASWKRLWINPGFGTRDTPGAFFQFARGDVDFFVCDVRYHRTPNKAPDNEHKTMLGEGQFQWLIDGLRQSQARFKVVAFGCTLERGEHDGWKIYTHARHQFFDAIRTNRIDGVVCFTGSPHNSFAEVHPESDRVGYPLVEVISSGIANSKTLSYATIDFDTTISDPAMAVRIVDGTGKVRETHQWTLAQLSHRDTSS